MEITIDEKTFNFVFGFDFLQEINKQNRVYLDNGVTLNAGVENVVFNLLGGDFETLITALHTANATEKPRVSIDALGKHIAADENTDYVSLVMEELKKSVFTKKKATEFEREILGAEKKAKAKSRKSK
ncbi:tail assembly chaperone [Enterococcus casseliflavus]|uniref:tail assembly chaperone n=1 Tax=Enterococcus casseliflavus TaxID=37734 RepID=UPI002DB8811F|nr:tail assembly chaperone [Enterococcus casseliflavus]MEB8400916.1 tail assembly chaperone [Enterococcus casseliflavus]